MAKAPSDRCATAGDLASDLGRFLDGRPILARRSSIVDRSAKWMRCHRAPITAAKAALFSLALWRARSVLNESTP
jgi:hypothetical protein